jgi:hypothetical protein
VKALEKLKGLRLIIQAGTSGVKPSGLRKGTEKDYFLQWPEIHQKSAA